MPAKKTQRKPAKPRSQRNPRLLAPRYPAKKPPPEPCLNRDCSNLQVCGAVRGLCSDCYEIARKKVKNGITTWWELAKRGDALPAKFNGYEPEHLLDPNEVDLS